MSEERFWKHPELPFVEYRRSSDSGRRYKPHMHKTFCIGAIGAGEVNFMIDGRTRKLRPGALALINPETLHYCNPESGKRSYYVLYLDVAWCAAVQRILWGHGTFGPVGLPLLEDDALYRDFVDTAESLPGDAGLAEKERRLVDLALRIFSRSCAPADGVETAADAAASAVPLRIARLKRRLGPELDESLPMKRAAAELEANPYSLLRQFKAAVGITPHLYRLNCRIEHARRLLAEGEDLARVAMDCGFFDQSHFHRHFKAMTAVTPKEYRVNFLQ
jgi:AraC-like DNA-binding protein